MTKKREHSIMPYSTSQNAAREEQHAVVGVVYQEDPVIFARTFPTPKELSVHSQIAIQRKHRLVHIKRNRTRSHGENNTNTVSASWKEVETDTKRRK